MTVKKKRSNIYIPVDLYDKLKTIANCWGNSVNGYLVWLIRNEVYDFEQLTEYGNTFENPKLVRPSFTDTPEKVCYLEYFEYIPKGGDECDLGWEWRCSNCNHDLMEHYEDLDAKTYEELGLLYCPHCGSRIIGTRFRKDNNSER